MRYLKLVVEGHQQPRQQHSRRSATDNRDVWQHPQKINVQDEQAGRHSQQVKEKQMGCSSIERSQSQGQSRFRLMVLIGIIAFAAFKYGDGHGDGHGDEYGDGYGDGCGDGCGDGKCTFDSDVVLLLRVDNCASRCITNNVGDFVEAPTIARGRVKGLGGNKASVVAVGTIKWIFDNDGGNSHSLLLERAPL